MPARAMAILHNNIKSFAHSRTLQIYNNEMMQRFCCVYPVLERRAHVSGYIRLQSARFFPFKYFI